jgi:hypothetical protein
MPRFSSAVPALALAVLLALACSDSTPLPDTRSIPLSIETIELRDAAADFEENAEHDDLHFVAVNEGGIVHPGLSQSCAADLVARFGSKTIEGTTDPRSSDADPTLNGLARRYAERYNRLVLGQLRAKGDAEGRALAARCG